MIWFGAFGVFTASATLRSRAWRSLGAVCHTRRWRNNSLGVRRQPACKIVSSPVAHSEAGQAHRIDLSRYRAALGGTRASEATVVHGGSGGIVEITKRVCECIDRAADQLLAGAAAAFDLASWPAPSSKDNCGWVTVWAPISLKPGAASRWTSSAESGLFIDLVPTSAPTQAQSLMIRSDRDSGSRGRNSRQSSSWSCSRTTIGPSRPPSVASFPPVRQP